MAKSLIVRLTAVSVVLLLAACAGGPARDQTEASDDGPIVYGQVGFSVDHVNVKNAAP